MICIYIYSYIYIYIQTGGDAITRSSRTHEDSTPEPQNPREVALSRSTPQSNCIGLKVEFFTRFLIKD